MAGSCAGRSGARLQRTGPQPFRPGQHLGGRAVGDGQPETERGQLGPVAGGPGPQLGRADGGPVGVDDPQPGPQRGAHAPRSPSSWRSRATACQALTRTGAGLAPRTLAACSSSGRATRRRPRSIATWPASSRTSAAASVQPDLSRAVASVRAESSSRLDRSPALQRACTATTRPGPPTGSIARGERRPPRSRPRRRRATSRRSAAPPRPAPGGPRPGSARCRPAPTPRWRARAAARASSPSRADSSTAHRSISPSGSTLAEPGQDLVDLRRTGPGRRAGRRPAPPAGPDGRGRGSRAGSKPSGPSS